MYSSIFELIQCDMILSLTLSPRGPGQFGCFYRIALHYVHTKETCRDSFGRTLANQIFFYNMDNTLFTLIFFPMREKYCNFHRTLKT
ncbi:hypothetical protein TSAR_007769 [Trichomalopsis sarcophagae]|uniref:Uncharacterized protein n=1 Tax=Trichomalopsis sarcophagae TaxID=543379 RepID=A0A232F0Q6_9HYME|nr:hypothetical protein TSAR_007769 [Trichomalopsis sarcophagae]